MKDTIYFAKTNEKAIIPTKNKEDGCYDIYSCFDENHIIIEPGEISLIPTGIASAFDSKYRIGLRERGSTGTRGMSCRAGQIDSGYRGEWFVPINNTTNKYICIYKNMDVALLELKHSNVSKTIFYPYEKAICQAAVEFVPDVDVNEISYDSLVEIKSKRMMGALGSTNK